MADVLLAHSYFLRYDPKQLRKMKPYAPLATLWAVAILRRAGYSVALFDAMLAEGEQEFERALRRHRPHFVALYEDSFNFLAKMCLTQMREAALRMADTARAAGATVIAAGPDVTDRPELYLARGVEYALIGEADVTLRELLDALTGHVPTALAAIPGVAYLDPAAHGGIRRTARRRPVRDLAALPPPAWDLVDADRYRGAWVQAHGFYSVNLAASRGCPYHCNWCAKPIWGQSYALRPAEDVAEEMALVKRRLAPDHIWFADDVFGLRPGWIGAFAEAVRARGAALPFTIQTRADRMTEEAVEDLRRAGCVEAWLGAESGSQRILDAMDKGTTVEQILVAVARLKRAGIRAGLFLQLGYPGETFDDILATAAMMREAMPDEIGVSVSYPLPGTRFHAMVRDQLGPKTNWTDSGDLAMLFQGTYTTGFYRGLHDLLHRELDARHRLALPAHAEAARAELAAVVEEWEQLRRTEADHRMPAPTRLVRTLPMTNAAYASAAGQG